FVRPGCARACPDCSVARPSRRGAPRPRRRRRRAPPREAPVCVTRSSLAPWPADDFASAVARVGIGGQYLGLGRPAEAPGVPAALVEVDPSCAQRPPANLAQILHELAQRGRRLWRLVGRAEPLTLDPRGMSESV